MNEGDRRAMIVSMMEQFFSGMGSDALGDLEDTGDGGAGLAEGAAVPDMTQFRAFEQLEDAFVTDNISEEIEQEPSVSSPLLLHIGLPPN